MSRNEMNQQPHMSPVTGCTLYVKGQWMLIIHLRPIALTQSRHEQTLGVFGLSLCSGKGTEGAFWANITGL